MVLKRIISYLDLSLRGISALGLAAAICRTLVAVTAHRTGSAPPRLRASFARAGVGIDRCRGDVYRRLPLRMCEGPSAGNPALYPAA